MPPSTLPVLAVANLHVTRDDTPILQGLEWQVSSGEHWVLLGPNGSGKSSLLAVLGGYLCPTTGTVEVFGKRFGQTDWRVLRSHFGIVSAALAAMVPLDEPAAFTVLSGRDGGIGLWADVSLAEMDLARNCLAAVEAEALALREWRFLSQGERQRVLIARALVRQPDLLILDEPCAGLDPAARERFLQFIARMLRREDGPSVLLVTHHVEEIVDGFSHLLALKEGRVTACGPLSETLDASLLEQLFEMPFELEKHRGRYRLAARVT